MMAATSAWGRVAALLEEKTGYAPPREGADWRCPAHPDSTPSLSMTARPGKVVLHCQAGCTIQNVLDALGLKMADLFDDESKPKREIISTYPYVDENGYLLFEVVRYAPKDFRQRVPDQSKTSGWRYSLGDVRRVIYRLPRVIEAVAQGWPVWIVEGEADVHALEAAGEVATCNPGGAGKWRPEYAPYFEGADVYVVADKDAVGRQHARRVLESLEGRAASVVIVEAITGKDASDHLSAGHTTDEFLRIRDDEVFVGDDMSEVQLQPPLEPLIVNPFVPVPLDLSRRPEPRPTVGDFLYRGGLVVLQSEPGVGKTWFALWVAMQIMRAGGSVFYFDEEGGEDLARERLFALGATNDLIDHRLHYLPFQARVWNDDDITALKALIAQADGGHAIAIFDSLPDFLSAAGLSEDKAQDVTSFVNRVLGPLREAGIAQLVLDHLVKPDKGKTKSERGRYSRGSGAKLAKADATILLEVAESFDTVTSGKLRCWKTKDRYGRLSLPRLDQPGWLVAVSVNDGRVALEHLTRRETPQADEPTECIEQIKALLSHPEMSELTVRSIRAVLPFGNRTIQDALEILAKQGELAVRGASRNSLMYRLARQPGTLFGEETA